MAVHTPSQPFPSAYEEVMALAILQARGLSNMPVQSINAEYVLLCREIREDKERRTKNGTWV